METEVQVIGFVFPVYAFSLPKPVEAFLKEVYLPKDVFLFAVATRGGSSCQVFEEIDRILEKKGIKLNARFFLDMPNNYLTMFTPPAEVEANKILDVAETRLRDISKFISRREDSKEKDPHESYFEKNILFPILSRVYKKTNYFGMEKKFCTDSKCTGCSLCSKLCLSGKIHMEEGIPVWNQQINCYHCLSCIHYCPAQAIQLKDTKTNKIGRYHNPYITFEDIILQKLRD
ncbi:4Fe-4S ferredoxin [Anaerocolumna chitinilytica]|uniref:4Fe-4S ferredoxin n=2 Tax=Anaerocolumna chitinilytica TaxID=1727145 RepID=A0A7I8DPP3_9FIRM|nr:4Fe-4S ferredoxin [Anaerocolumna chitinilytica]